LPNRACVGKGGERERLRREKEWSKEAIVKKRKETLPAYRSPKRRGTTVGWLGKILSIHAGKERREGHQFGKREEGETAFESMGRKRLRRTTLLWLIEKERDERQTYEKGGGGNMLEDRARQKQVKGPLKEGKKNPLV